jgi:hypothetical protein
MTAKGDDAPSIPAAADPARFPDGRLRPGAVLNPRPAQGPQERQDDPPREAAPRSGHAREAPRATRRLNHPGLPEAPFVERMGR